MQIRTLILTLLVSSWAMAQGFGISLGLSSAKPRSIDGTTFNNQLGAYIGGSYRWKELTFGLGYRTPGKSTITYDGVESKDEFKWSFSEASLTYGIPFRGADLTQRILLGAAARRETTKAEDTIVGMSASDNRNRIWWKVGYELEGEVDEVRTSLGLFYAGASKETYNPTKDYTPQEALRLFAPTSELQIMVTFRF